MKLRIALFSLLSVLFYLTCNTYQPPTVLEYSIGLSISTTNPIVFKNYTFSIDAGDNKFSSIKVYTDPAGFIDSAMMNNALKNDNAVSGYFLKPGTCKFFVEGIAPDQRTFKDSVTITVRNPYKITGPSLLAIEETGYFRLGPADTFALSGLKLLVNWKENDKSPSPLNISTPFTFTVIDSGSQKVTAIIVDTVNKHSYTVDSLEFKVPGHRPIIDSIKIVKKDLIAGDSLIFYLKASDKDSTSQRVVLTSVKNDTLRIDTIQLLPGKLYDSLFTVQRPFIVSGGYVLTITVIDPSGLVSRAISDSFTVTANPPVVTYVPDSTVMFIPFNSPSTLFVTGTAEIYHWSVDGEAFTTTIPQLTRNFLSSLNLKDSATIIVYGIDKYSYNGKPDTVKLYKSNTFYRLALSHIPGDSAYRDSAYWEVKTPDTGIVKANSAKFYWSLIRKAVGDTIYRDSLTNIDNSLSRLSIKGLTIAGINLDSIDLAVSVVLKDAGDTSHTSAILQNESKIRLFRPNVRLTSILPDSISTDKPVSVKFKVSDVENGVVTSIFWKYADSASAHPLASTDSMLTFTWKTAGPRTLCIWAFDNDGQISDTLKPIFNVIKNQPKITGISWRPTPIYSKDPCTLSVAVQPGISGARIDSVHWSCPTSSTLPTSGTTLGLTFPVSFATPGWQKVTVTVYDSLHDSASGIDSVLIASGNPSVELRSILPNGDSISAKATATFKYAVSTARNGTIDSVFWRQKGLSSIHGLKVAGSDSSFSNVWTDTGSVTLQLWARDNLKNTADTLTRTIKIVKSQPRITGFSFKPAKVYTNEPCSLSITAARGYSRAKIDSIHWSCPTWTGPATRKTTTDATIPASFATPGRHMITVVLYDSLLDSSSRVDSVSVLSGKPSLSIPQILPRTDSISTKVPAIFKYAVSTLRSGNVDSVFWQQTGQTAVTGIKVSGSDSTFRITWPDSGHVAIKIWARDNVDNQTDTTINLVIVKNRPSVSAFIVPSGTPPSKRAYNYTIVPRRGFSGSRITRYHWVYPTGSGTKDSMRTDSTLLLQFDTPGAKIISVYVQDSLNDTSTLFIDTVTIDQGLPVVTSLAIDSSASGGSGIYFNDFIKVTIRAKDTNGTITSYRAVLRNNASGDSIVAQGPDSALSLIVAVGHDGGYSLKVYAYDDDVLLSAAFPATPKTLTIRAGKPVVTAFTPPTGLWIYDTLTFRYSARDTNGVLAKIIFNWGDASKLDTAIISPVKDTVLNRDITHRYMSSGTFTVNVSALDDDGQTSTSPFNVTIDKGLPHVKSIKDTVIIWANTPGGEIDTINFAATAGDVNVNGSIKKYIWYLTSPFDAINPDTVSTTTNSLIVDRNSNFWFPRSGGFKTDSTYKCMVKVLDDDGFAAVDTFCYYIESAPYYGFQGNIKCKNGNPFWDGSGWSRDLYWFEYTPDAIAGLGLDSIKLSWFPYQVSLEAAQYHHITVKVTVTGAESSGGPISYNDITTIADSIPFLSIMHYDADSSQWVGMWRPPLNFFAKYQNSTITQMNFSVEMAVYRRSGARGNTSQSFYIINTKW